MKKWLIAFLFLAFSFNVYAADQNLTDKSADATPTTDDLVYTVNDPLGTPGDRKVTLDNLSKGLNASNMGSGTLAVNRGGTGAATLTDGGILLGSGTSAITALGVLANGSIIVGDGATDPVALAAFTSSTGDLKHEAGGLEADVNAYDGLVGITGGATFNQTGTTTQIIIFDGAGAPTSAALSSDVTMDNAGAVTIADSVTVTGWTMGASVATTAGADDADTSLATTAWCQTTQDYLKTAELTAASIEAILTNNSIDFGTGAVAAVEFNLADGEYIEWGGDENITFDGTDFQISDSLDFGTNIWTDTLAGYVDQDVQSGTTPTFTATNITGVPAASILAGTLGTGAYVFDNTISGITTCTADEFNLDDDEVIEWGTDETFTFESTRTDFILSDDLIIEDVNPGIAIRCNDDNVIHGLHYHVNERWPLIFYKGTDTGAGADIDNILWAYDSSLIRYDYDGSAEIADIVPTNQIKHLSWSVDPGSWYDSDAEIFLLEIGDDAPNGIIIDEWKTSCQINNPSPEVSATLHYADAWISLASAVTIDTLTTSSGISSEDTDANINGGAPIPNGKVMYILFTSDPEGTATQWHGDIWYHII